MDKDGSKILVCSIMELIKVVVSLSCRTECLVILTADRAHDRHALQIRTVLKDIHRSQCLAHTGVTYTWVFNNDQYWTVNTMGTNTVTAKVSLQAVRPSHSRCNYDLHTMGRAPLSFTRGYLTSLPSPQQIPRNLTRLTGVSSSGLIRMQQFQWVTGSRFHRCTILFQRPIKTISI